MDRRGHGGNKGKRKSNAEWRGVLPAKTIKSGEDFHEFKDHRGTQKATAFGPYPSAIPPACVERTGQGSQLASVSGRRHINECTRNSREADTVTKPSRLAKRFEQRFRFLQGRRREPFGKAAVNGSQQGARPAPLAAITGLRTAS